MRRLAAAAPAQVIAEGAAGVAHVFGTAVVTDHDALRIAALIDPAFLVEVGWDATTALLSPPPAHPLLGRPVCRAAGCAATAPGSDRVCGACRRRLVEHGLDMAQVSELPARPRPTRWPAPCEVPGCGRTWESSRSGLCRGHHDQQRATGTDTVTFLAAAVPLATLPLCAVAACARQRRRVDGRYCEAHQIRLRRARGHDGAAFDEQAWAATEPAGGLGGQVSLRGLAPRVIAEMLFGLQQRCRTDGVKTKEPDLRAWCNQLRAGHAASVIGLDAKSDAWNTYTAMVNAIVAHARRALATPETEVTSDVWDLVVFGHRGTVDFTGIAQPWLRQAAKRWAADDLPKRKIRPGRRTSGGLTVRHHVGCVQRLSQVLAQRSDGGTVPAVLGRADIEVFLNRLAYLESTSQISGDARFRACHEVRTVLTRIRAMGLTRPGEAAGGLGDDFAIHRTDIPAQVTGDRGRDLPAEILRQICGHLDLLASPVMRAAIELAIDTGRRPEEICDLPYDCLARDNDGLPVLVYDNHKAGRLGRRLPITEPTAAVITAQQHHVRARYPATLVGELKLLPTDRRNPDGSKAITGFSLAFRHRQWIEELPPLRTADGTEFDKTRVVLYAYRHSYAQRHADAGVPIDVLAELMDHRKLDTTTGYYHVGEDRRHDAVDRVAAMQFDRNGNRVWRDAQQLLDSERARRAVGEVAVPYGSCTEPSNVTAGGSACPFRFRCAGCDHFRTDVSYLPDLTAYLEDLLRTRERLLATADLDDWARADAMPASAEITVIRRLIDRVRGGLEDLTDHDRAQIDQAIAVVRQHRAATTGLPRTRQPLPVFRPERPA